MTFSSSNVRFRLTTPSSPARVLDFNMGTKRTVMVHADHIKNCVQGRGADTLMCEKVDMRMRDGFSVPVVLVYDKRFYTETSPWIMFTRGIHACKEDLAMTPSRLSLTDRGIVCAYPMVRGKYYLVSCNSFQVHPSLTTTGSSLASATANPHISMTSLMLQSSLRKMSLRKQSLYAPQTLQAATPPSPVCLRNHTCSKAPLS